MQTVVIFLPITLLDWNIFFVMTNEFVRWTDNLALIYQLLDPVCRPARDTGDCKDRCKDLDWQLQHCINKSAVEINIRANRLEGTADGSLISFAAIRSTLSYSANSSCKPFSSESFFAYFFRITALGSDSL